MKSDFSTNKSASLLSMKPSSSRSKITVTSSVIEPNEMRTKWTNSFGLLLAAPSAIFTGMETAAHRIWETNPNSSSAGKLLVMPYISFTKPKLLLHACNCLCGFIIHDFVISKLNHLSFRISHLTFHITHLTFQIK